MTKRALLIAFFYPPFKGSSGVQRALKVSSYLRDSGWDCDVLTVHPRAYYTGTSSDLLKDVPDDIEVVRAFGLDAQRHLSLFGRYPQFLALPDRWASWIWGGVRAGKKMLRQRNYDLLWSTYPISSAHAIGLKLAEHSGLPWVADCRDSMTEEDFPTEPAVFKSMRRLEQDVVAKANLVTFTAPSTLAMYAERYPEQADEKWHVIENGYDEPSFEGLRAHTASTPDGQPLKLVHAGLLYPSERNPLPFFDAIKALKDNGTLAKNPIKVVLRATGHDDSYRDVLKKLDIEQYVELAPGVAYRDALQEMMLADGLLIFQAANCNHQIPAKVYEYLRAGRPILALTDPAGDTADVLRRNGHDHLCDLTRSEDIQLHLANFIQGLRTDTLQASTRSGEQYSRRAQTAQLAALFDQILAAEKNA